MRTRIQKWGNSLALRIPKTFIQETGLAAESEVEISLLDGQIVVAPIQPTETLEDLLAQITDENIHPEIDFGPPVGKEIW